MRLKGDEMKKRKQRGRILNIHYLFCQPVNPTFQPFVLSYFFAHSFMPHGIREIFPGPEGF